MSSATASLEASSKCNKYRQLKQNPNIVVTTG